MSKGLEALKELKMWADNGYCACKPEKADELASIIENKLKALELMKKYNVRPSDFHYHTTYEVYKCNMSFIEDEELMSEEEYNLLKEVLNEK